jgi:hypothetical protein
MLHSLFYLTTALHVSGVTITHLQRYKTTVTTASGNLHRIVVCCYRRRVGSGLSVLWVAYSNVPVLSHCSLLRNSWPQPTGVLEHCREWETNCWFSVFRGVSYWSRPSGDEGYQCTCLYSQFYLQGDRNFPDAEIPVTYTSEFRKLSGSRTFYKLLTRGAIYL